MHDPHLVAGAAGSDIKIARSLTVAIQHSAVGQMQLVASPLRLSRTPPEYRDPPPLLGEHTAQVLTTLLELSTDQIANLRHAGIIEVNQP